MWGLIRREQNTLGQSVIPSSAFANSFVSPMTDSTANTPTPATLHVHTHPPERSWGRRIVLVLLLISVMVNFAQLAAFRDYSSGSKAPYERFVEGTLRSSDKIALLEIEGVIMPPYTDRILETIKRIREDEQVRGVVVVVDSPGGLVADSHRIYRALQRLRETKPMVVSMGRLAASGGYYVAMGGGPETKIFAEEVTWTGSIGVIIPRYDLSELGAKFGVRSDPLKTGPLKDTLDPFRPLGDEERQLWNAILSEALDQFVQVIDQGRPALDEAAIRRLATGQIYTARQAQQLKLIDEIGDRDAAIDALKKDLHLEQARIVRYEYPAGLLEVLLGTEAALSSAQDDPLHRLLEASVPRAMYLFGGLAGWSAP